MGRHRKIKDMEEVAKAIKECHGGKYAAARKLGITFQTLQNYCNQDPSLNDVVKEAKGHMLDTVEHQLFEKAMAGEPWAICFTLKTIGKQRNYSERIEHRHGGDPTAPAISQQVTLKDLNLPLEVRLQLLQAVREANKKKEQQNGQ
jgi:hypothetical protein